MVLSRRVRTQTRTLGQEEPHVPKSSDYVLPEKKPGQWGAQGGIEGPGRKRYRRRDQGWNLCRVASLAVSHLPAPSSWEESEPLHGTRWQQSALDPLNPKTWFYPLPDNGAP